MMGGKRFLVAVLCLGLMLAVSAPLMAADKNGKDTADQIKSINPHRYRHIFMTAGGMAVGAGIGMILGGAPSVAKGMLIGGGGMSAYYLHRHPNADGGWHNWAHIASYTALGSGLGWAICKCGDGSAFGALIGGGASSIWLAEHPNRRRTASLDRDRHNRPVKQIDPKAAGLTMPEHKTATAGASQ